jgi:hypothetical protein
MKLVALKNEIEEFEIPKVKIDFANSVGVIYNNYLVLHKHNVNKSIGIDSIKHIRLRKKKKVLLNLFCFFVGLSLLTVFAFKTVTYLEGFLLGVLSLFLFLASYGINNTSYFLILTERNLNFIELQIDKACKTDAKKLIFKIEKEIKKYNKIKISH